MKLTTAFAGVDVGERCTGTVHFFGLNAAELIRRKIVEPREHRIPGRACFASGTREDAPSERVIDYFFTGL